MKFSEFSRTKILIGLVLVFNISFAAICGKNQKATIAVATDDFAEAQISAANLLVNARNTGLISQEDINEIKPFLQQANDYNAKAIEYGRSLAKDPTNTTTKNDLIDTLNQISNVLVRANNAGIFRIKDPALRSAFSALIVVMQNSATSIIRLVRR